MKKSEIFNIAWHLWNNVDQAHHDTSIKALMESAPVEALKTFIEEMLRDEGGSEWMADEAIVEKAKKLVKWSE